MNHAVIAQRYVSVWWSVSILAAAVMALSGCHVQQEARPSTRTHKEPSNSEPNGTSQQVPWQFKLQLQHDKPLVIEGHVLDASGQPLEGAHVAVLAEFPLPARPRPLPPRTLGQTTTDGSGAFRATMPSLPLHQCTRLYAIARRAGYGMGIKELYGMALQHAVTFRLEQEQPVRGRVVGPEGRPAAGVQVHLRVIAELQPGWPPAASIRRFWPPARRPLAWPEPPTSDDQGRFVLQGIPRVAASTLYLRLEIDDRRFAPFDPDLTILPCRDQEQAFLITSDGSEEVTIQLEAPRIVEGTVICKDTRKPIACAWLSVVFSNCNPTGDLQVWGVWVKADRQGRFRARGRPCQYLTIYAYPPVGLPYPAWVEESTEWPEGATRREVTVEVPRGILVRGKIVEADSGAGVPGAGVEYQLRTQKTPYYDKFFSLQIYWAAEYRKILTDSDGSFHMAVVPGLGHLMVKAPTPDFVSRYVTHGEVQYDKPGGFYYVLEGLGKIDPKPGTEAIDLIIPLRRGLTVRGLVVGPDGELVDKAMLLTTAYPRLRLCHSVPTTAWPRPVTDGRFELRGCDRAKPRRVYFLDVEHQWGATVSLDAAKTQRAPLTVRLLPCGSASVRFVDQQGHPWANAKVPVSVYLLFVKGPVNPVYGSFDSRHLSWWMTALDRHRYGNLRTDAKGRVTFPTLIPGAPYMLRLKDEPLSRENLEEKEFDFQVQSGQNLDLGEITLKRPEKAGQ